MWIKSLAPVEKGSAVFHSLIVFPPESIYFIGSCKVMFFCFWEISFWSVVFFKCTNHTVPFVVLLCTCACAWTVVFLYFLRQGDPSGGSWGILLQEKHGGLSYTAFTCVPNLTCAVRGAFREGKSTSLWCHEPPTDANSGSDWNLSGTAGEPGPADSCCKCCCVISRFIHRGSLDIPFSEILFLWKSQELSLWSTSWGVGRGYCFDLGL